MNERVVVKLLELARAVVKLAMEIVKVMVK